MIHEGMDFKTYLERIDYSASFVKSIWTTQSPRAAKYLKDNPVRSTAAMELGTAVHKFILEGEEEFAKEYMLRPDGMKFTTKEGKAWKAANLGKRILKPEVLLQVKAIAASAFEYLDKEAPEVRDVIRKGIPEVTYTNEIHGLPFKSRFDCVLKQDNVIVELKTIADIQNYCRDSYKRGYHLAEYLYRHQLARETGCAPDAAIFIYLFVETKPPYDCLHCESTRDYHEKASTQFADICEIIKRCEDENHWPGFGSGKGIIMDLPEWVKNKDMAWS